MIKNKNRLIKSVVSVCLVVCFFVFYPVANVEAYTETFYLRANGDGSAPETIDGAFDVSDFNTPSNWDTDDSDDGKIGPNDTVIILDDDGVIRPAGPGAASKALLTIQGSGLSGKPITIQGEAVGDPILHGSLSKNDDSDSDNNSDYSPRRRSRSQSDNSSEQESDPYYDDSDDHSDDSEEDDSED